MLARSLSPEERWRAAGTPYLPLGRLALARCIRLPSPVRQSRWSSFAVGADRTLVAMQSSSIQRQGGLKSSLTDVTHDPRQNFQQACYNASNDLTRRCSEPLAAPRSSFDSSSPMTQAFGLPVYVAAAQLAPFDDFHLQPPATRALASGR